MQLQLALDSLTIEQSVRLLDKVADLIDIVEVGTPFILREGVKAVTAIRQTYPALTVLADLKIMDAGEYEAQIGFEAGADIVTVLGLAHQATIQAALAQARHYKRQVMVDLIAAPDVPTRAAALDRLGCDYICVHTASDTQRQAGNSTLDLSLVSQQLQRAKLAVAGGVKPTTLPQIVPFKPDIVVVGSYITSHPNPRLATLEIKEHLGQEP